MHKIERELIKKTKLDEQGEDEDRQEYLNRLCEAVNQLDEAEWAALSEGAKRWFNTAAKSIQNKKAVADFEADGKDKPAPKAPPKAKEREQEDEPEEESEEGEGEDEPEDESGEEEDGDAEEEVEEEEPPRKTTKPKPAAAKDGAKEKPRGMSAVAFVRHYVATHPTSEVSEIAEATEKAGYTTLSKSSIGTIRSDFRSIAKIIKELGFLKKDVNLGV